MQIANVYIKNYRVISEISIDFHNISSLIGANNSGKSTIFKAIELFFEANSRVSIDDFHRKNTADPIEVRIVFAQLTDDEVQDFGSAVVDGELSISREFTVANPVSPNYSVNARVFPGFEEIRSASAASERLSAYRRIQANHGLPPVRSAADVDAAIAAWEEANPDQLRDMSIRGFFGATNVANGKIKKKTSLRLIPAVRDSAEEAKTGRRSAVLELLSDITQQTFENRRELQEFLASAEQRVSELTDPETIPELAEIGNEISRIVQYYYSDSSVVAEWERIDAIEVNFPKPKIAVRNSDITTDIDFVGHGLQRVILFSLIQYMAERSYIDEDLREEFEEPQSDIILLVEEPEIYQHPVKQTILYRNFGRIVSTFNRTNGIRFQIIFATHSEKFVSMRDFEICRIVRKAMNDESIISNDVGWVRLSDCINDFAAFHEPPVEPMDEEAFAAKLHIFTREICEGFFAGKVVLVEGASDKPILEAYYESIGRDNHLEGIQVLATGGKGVMQKPAYIFRKVGIPTFLIFDNDNRKEEGAIRERAISENRFLQKILEIDDVVDMPVGLANGFYAHDGNLEAYLRQVIGAASYDQQFEVLSNRWGLPVKDIKKTPAAFATIIRTGLAGGYRFDELQQIVAAIDEL